MNLDPTTEQGIIHEVKSSVLFHCPYCGRAVTLARLLRYPEKIAGVFTPVYRCGCGKHMGAPVAGDCEKP
jgi:predicted RNA-binding Zn-ribbon protein involved in translation (DUF1610 family)